MRKEMPTLKRILSISVLQNMSAARNAEAGGTSVIFAVRSVHYAELI